MQGGRWKKKGSMEKREKGVSDDNEVRTKRMMTHKTKTKLKENKIE